MVKKKMEKNKPKEEKVKKNSEESMLKNIILIGGVIILLSLVLYIYTQSQNSYTYKNIEFEKTLIGNITFYETTTLAKGANGKLFGFRLRTNPRELTTIPFENLDNLRIMKLNIIASEEGKSFNCEGYGVIAIPNLQRLFTEMGADFGKEEGSNCDPDGKYNHFTLKYGNKTEIKEVGNRCYEIIIKGDDNECEILPATEKLMVELYSRYLNL